MQQKGTTNNCYLINIQWSNLPNQIPDNYIQSSQNRLVLYFFYFMNVSKYYSLVHHYDMVEIPVSQLMMEVISSYKIAQIYHL